jgi:hypothetical protein
MRNPQSRENHYRFRELSQEENFGSNSHTAGRIQPIYSSVNETHEGVVRRASGFEFAGMSRTAAVLMR